MRPKDPGSLAKKIPGTNSCSRSTALPLTDAGSEALNVVARYYFSGLFPDLAVITNSIQDFLEDMAASMAFTSEAAAVAAAASPVLYLYREEKHTFIAEELLLEGLEKASQNDFETREIWHGPSLLETMGIRRELRKWEHESLSRQARALTILTRSGVSLGTFATRENRDQGTTTDQVVSKFITTHCRPHLGANHYPLHPELVSRITANIGSSCKNGYNQTVVNEAIMTFVDRVNTDLRL